MLDADNQNTSKISAKRRLKMKFDSNISAVKQGRRESKLKDEQELRIIIAILFIITLACGFFLFSAKSEHTTLPFAFASGWAGFFIGCEKAQRK